MEFQEWQKGRELRLAAQTSALTDCQNSRQGLRQTHRRIS